MRRHLERGRAARTVGALLRPQLVVLALLLAPLGMAAGSAPAASAATVVTIGQTSLTPSWTTYSGYTGAWGVPFVSASLPADWYWGSKFVVPQGNWAVTSWSTRNWGGSMRMIVLRPLGSGSYSVVGQSDTEMLSSDQGTATFTLDSAIPVQRGDILGSWFGPNTGAYHDLNGGSDSVEITATASPPATGSTVSRTYSLGNEILVISATLEAVPDTTPPLVSNVVATPNPVVFNRTSTLRATIDDSTTGDSNVSSAQYSIDGGAWQPMAASDGSFDSATETVTATLPAGLSAGGRAVCIRGGDAAGYTSDGSACITVTVLADNTPPLVSSVVPTPNPVALNTTSTLTATIDDSMTGGSAIAAASYKLTDSYGNTLSTGSVSGTFGSVSATVSTTVPAQTTAGVDTLCVSGTDSVGNTSDPTCVPFVVYDPSGGFVTGGGWIYSTAGGYRADLTLAGKATFGFVSKYLKGATVPTGNTQFVFQAGSLGFTSTSYQWLVVNQGGTNAQFKGSGTINGTGSFTFMLWATQGSPCTFRIQITDDSDNDAVVYDNGVQQALGGGSIIVHTGK
ncbi:MAG: hypothetical protein ACYC65_11580 [Candidatus Limnocylindrales bacterium]